MKPISLLIAASLLSVVPHDTAVRESVDVVEVNNFFDQDGKYVFTQLIFRDWCEAADCHQIRAWRMVKPRQTPPIEQPFVDEISEVAKCDLRWRSFATHGPMLPRELDGKFVCHWLDGEVERVITARECRETYTVHDPEVSERESLPKEKRAELRKPISGKGR